MSTRGTLGQSGLSDIMQPRYICPPSCSCRQSQKDIHLHPLVVLVHKLSIISFWVHIIVTILIGVEWNWGRIMTNQHEYMRFNTNEVRI
jgi:hypothetical protein